MDITIEDFMTRFKPIRNTFELSSPIMNMMFEKDDDEQSEFVESKDIHNIWSYNPTQGLINGMSFKRGVIGYVVCKTPWTFPEGTIIVKV